MEKSIDDIKEIKRILIAIGRSNNAIEKLSKNIINKNMSSARWQVLSAVHHLKNPTISTIARALRSTRQNISILIKSLKSEGMVMENENPNHSRSKIYGLTDLGLNSLIRVSEQRDLWCVDIGMKINSEDLKITRNVLNNLTKILENNNLLSK